MKQHFIPTIILIATACQTHSIPLGAKLHTDTADTSSYTSTSDSATDTNDTHSYDSGQETGGETGDMQYPVTLETVSALTGVVYQSEQALFSATATIADEDLNTTEGDTHTATLTVDASLESLVATTTATMTNATTVTYGMTWNKIPWSDYPTGIIEGTATLTVCDATENCASETLSVVGYKEEKIAIYSADQDVQVAEEHPTENYEGGALSIGTSTSGRKRSLVSFSVDDIAETYVISAEMILSAESGTCRSSTNNQNCGYDITMEVYEPTASWDAATATWNSAGEAYDATALVAQTDSPINLPYGGTGTYTVDISSVVSASWVPGTNTGVLLKAATESTDASEQVDVTIGSLDYGTAASLEVVYWK